MVFCTGCHTEYPNRHSYATHINRAPSSAPCRQVYFALGQHGTSRTQRKRRKTSSREDDYINVGSEHFEDSSESEDSDDAPVPFRGDMFGGDYASSELPGWGVPSEDNKQGAVDGLSDQMEPGGGSDDDDDSAALLAQAAEASAPTWEPERAGANDAEDRGDASGFSEPAPANEDPDVSPAPAVDNIRQERMESALRCKVHIKTYPLSRAGQPIQSHSPYPTTPPSPLAQSTSAVPSPLVATSEEARSGQPQLGPSATGYQGYAEQLQDENHETAPSPITASSVSNVYTPFKSKIDWEIARWAKLRGSGSTAVTELLSIENVSTLLCGNASLCAVLLTPSHLYL